MISLTHRGGSCVAFPLARPRLSRLCPESHHGCQTCGAAEGRLFRHCDSHRGGAEGPELPSRRPATCGSRWGGTPRGSATEPCLRSRSGVWGAVPRRADGSKSWRCHEPLAAVAGQRWAAAGPLALQRRGVANAGSLAALPLLSDALPAWLLPGSLASCEHRWALEQLLSVGDVSMGLPGIVSLAIFVNPMLEAMPRIRREGTVGRLPLLPYSAMAAQGLVWTFYGVVVGNPAIWTPNFCAMVLGCWYWRVYSRHCPPNADWLPYTQAHHAVGFLATTAMCTGAFCLLSDRLAVTAIGLLGNTMTLAMFGGPLAAIRTVIRDKSTRSMPFGFTCAVNINCNLWFFYAYFMLDDPFIYFQDGIGLLLTTVQLALFCRYGIHR